MSQKGASLASWLVISIGVLIAGEVAYADEHAHHHCGRHRFGQFSEWSEPVNLGPGINSPYLDQHPATTRDGLSLYFQSNRPGGLGGLDIWVSRRATVDDPWGPPVNVRNVNSAFNDSLPNITPDGHVLYITSPRPGGCGAADLYISTREDVEDDLAWSAPVNLGCSPDGPNTRDFEAGAAFLRCDDEFEYLFFQVEGADLGPYPGAPPDCGRGDLAVSMRHRGDAHGDRNEQLRPWPVGTIIEALCSPMDDFRPAIRSDGLEIFFHSNRVGGFGRGDLYTSTRPSFQPHWSRPVNLGPRINTEVDEAGAAISFDGKTLYFTSDRDGGFGDFDLYSITRIEHEGSDEDD
jgi:hypothetical protein